MPSLLKLAYSTLLPATCDLELSQSLISFLENGGRSILFAETGEEYATGVMNPERSAFETAERWRSEVGRARSVFGPLLIALDADISAVHRLQYLTPPLPSLSEAEQMTSADLESRVQAMAAAARSLGVNLLISPTADVVSGHNDWLAGRTLGTEIASVSRLVDAYVRGVVKSGIGATLKHFPGHPVLEGVPATEDAYVPLSMDELRPYLEPFKAGIAAGAHAVLMGPAVFEATETPTAGSISPELINLLRTDLNFRGLVITCDLDHRATMQDRGISETAILALLAGADLLLLSPKSVPHLREIAAAIAASVESGRLPLMRLESAVAAIDRTIAKVAH